MSINIIHNILNINVLLCHFIFTSRFKFQLANFSFTEDSVFPSMPIAEMRNFESVNKKHTVGSLQVNNTWHCTSDPILFFFLSLAGNDSL